MLLILRDASLLYVGGAELLLPWMYAQSVRLDIFLAQTFAPAGVTLALQLPSVFAIYAHYALHGPLQ